MSAPVASPETRQCHDCAAIIHPREPHYSGVPIGGVNAHLCRFCHTKRFAAPSTVPDAVNHPAHYTRGGIEAIDVIEAWGLGFCLGNTVKYIARAGHKGDVLEDLKKSRWYLDREIARLAGKPEDA